MNVRAAAAAAVICLMVIACSDDESSVPNPITQLFLFEVEAANFAWQPRWHGVYLDRDGSLYKWDLTGREWTPSEPEAFSEAELLEKYEFGRELHATVDRATLLEYFALVQEAAEGELSERINTCIDAGGVTYTAFVFDRATEKYHPILLRMEGDWFQENESEAARSLHQWLFALTGFSNCTP